jgi:site-specific recombinase XerD
VLSPEEYARLLAACPPQLKPVVQLAYHTGMRRSEILSLTWGQVDLREGFIKLVLIQKVVNSCWCFSVGGPFLAGVLVNQNL